MNYRIVIMPLAKANLLDIKDYIENNLQSPETAHNYIRKIMKRIALLSETPFIYPLYNDEPWRSKGLRHFPVDKYIVYYKVDEQTKTVNVVKVTYGMRDSSMQLKEI